MGFISFLALGLFAGAIAKGLMPGEQGGGWFATLALGVIGANIGGWLGSVLFNVNLTSFWSIQTWVLAIAGSIVALAIWGLLTGKKK
ncbi:GlsB/YeaQ/YmgE family stress response membrane protein [Schaalia suimastitidis]|uniref:GlsB/YeaQ/YmgE family stress response membrane protein n=1 Tax=Schaalia suimastitidis TaxID=121163 RepID=UPI0003FD895F|nr:GlsB/YeaQ/YmgE family stress response membrane protein [Schaalia suimastitidis]